MFSILITGVNGFVESNLVKAFSEKNFIYGVDIISPKVNSVKQDYYWNELSNVPECSTIIHLAGKAHVTKKQNNAEACFEMNTGLTE